MKAKYLFILLLIIGLAACKKDESKLYVYADTGDIDWSESFVPYGKTLQFNIIAQSKESPLASLNLKSYDSQYLEQTWLDTTFTVSVNNVNIPLRFQLLAYPDTTGISFTLTGRTQEGTQSTYSFTLFCLPTQNRLTENDLVTLYSAASDKPSAFSLDKLDVLLQQEAEQTANCFYDMPQADENNDILSRTWVSQTGLYFARGGDFSYGTATISSLMATYKNTQHQTKISNLQNDEVILIGDDKQAKAVVKILNIYDEQGTEQDRYQFAIKVIQ